MCILTRAKIHILYKQFSDQPVVRFCSLYFLHSSAHGWMHMFRLEYIFLNVIKGYLRLTAMNRSRLFVIQEYIFRSTEQL